LLDIVQIKRFGGGGGNRTRIQELRPVKSTRLVRLLRVSFAKSQQTDKTFSQTSLAKSRSRSQTENASQLKISCASAGRFKLTSGKTSL